MTVETYVTDTRGRAVIEKDPQALLDYPFDFSAYLTPLSDTITAAAFTVDGATLASSSHTTTTATAWVSGGTVGQLVTVTCEITTAGGRIDDRSIFLKIKEK